MRSTDQLLALYAYHFDTTLRLVSLAESLAEVQHVQPPELGRRSIHDLLFHILDTDRGWRVGLETGKRPEPLRREDFDLAALKRGFEKEKSAWGELLASLDEGQIGGDVKLEAGPGRVFSFGRWQVLYHLLFHGMQHWAEVAERLTRAGESPGDIDFIFYRP